MLRALTEAMIQSPLRRRKRLLKALLALRNGKPVRSHYGPLLKVAARDTTNFFCVSGCNEQDYGDVATALRALRPGMAFIDVGANAGLFSMIAAGLVGARGAVLAFEPSPMLFRGLVENAALNALANFHPFQAALGASTRLAPFALAEPGHTGLAHLSETGGATVLQLAFDDLAVVFDAIIGTRRTMLKIDVEGAEAAVAHGMRNFLARPQVECAIVEVNEAHLSRFGTHPKALYAAFAQVGLRPRRGLDTAEHYNEVFVRTTI